MSVTSVGRLAALLAGLVLAGCASQLPKPALPESVALTPQEEAVAWVAHQAAVTGLGEWVLHGRISVTTEDDSWRGKLRWQQGAQDFQMYFEAPMGLGAARLSTSSAGVVMQVSNGKTYYAADVEDLMYQFIGMHLPLAGLRYWVTGLPQPGMPSSVVEYDGAGRLAHLQQADWDIHYRGYLNTGDVDLPKKVFIENSRLNVRLVIEHWGVQT